MDYLQASFKQPPITLLNEWVINKTVDLACRSVPGLELLTTFQVAQLIGHRGSPSCFSPCIFSIPAGWRKRKSLQCPLLILIGLKPYQSDSFTQLLLPLLQTQSGWLKQRGSLLMHCKSILPLPSLPFLGACDLSIRLVVQVRSALFQKSTKSMFENRPPNSWMK